HFGQLIVDGLPRRDATTKERQAMTKTTHGKVRGKIIELDEDLGMAEGQEVEVHVRVVPPSRTWGEGILRTAGALADDPYWAAIAIGMRSWRKSTGPAGWSAGLKGNLNDAPAGYQHLLRAHAPPGWPCSPFLPVCWRHRHFHGRPGRIVGRCLQASEPTEVA